jgi:hypothetical protein
MSIKEYNPNSRCLQLYSIHGTKCAGNISKIVFHPLIRKLLKQYI